MCGIGLIASGARILGIPQRNLDQILVQPSATTAPVSVESVELHPTVQELCSILKRRGPDQIGLETVLVQGDEQFTAVGTSLGIEDSHACLQFVGASLQLRGDQPVRQPLEDSHGNLLVYNGEIFGGLTVEAGENDGVALLAALQDCCCCRVKSSIKGETYCEHDTSVPRLLSSIRGPWALIFWQVKSQTLWFGRDAVGRRSLLVHWPCLSDKRLVLSSVAPTHFDGDECSTSGDMGGCRTQVGSAGYKDCPASYWEELVCGIYSISFESNSSNLAPISLGADGGQLSQAGVHGHVQDHEWQGSSLRKLLSWDRQHVVPGSMNSASLEGESAIRVLKSLQEAVRLRTCNIKCRIAEDAWHEEETRDIQPEPYTPVAILFSGGIDSMILAALADQSSPCEWGIDLLNVSFEGSKAPDRITAVSGLAELKIMSPQRRWRLVEVDADMEGVGHVRQEVLGLIHPSKTHMDFNIGTALWLASGGDGFVHSTSGNLEDDSGETLTEKAGMHLCKSKARVVLVGSGADEQCAGYGRHRTKFKLGGWDALNAEMRLDVQRLWKRNLGRDDRCVGDHGKEARFPFLDEAVIETLLDLPLWEIADLTQPSGQGDKKILRKVAQLLGIRDASSLPKRAIQFGSRIAQESNKREFGSNRAANMASAGSAILRA